LDCWWKFNITPRYLLAGAGIQTSALAFGGVDPGVFSATEEYNGTSWTAGGNLNTARYALGGAGTSETSGLAFGGNDAVPAVTGATELYDGTSWTNSPASMGTGRNEGGSLGTQAAALFFGGFAPLRTTATEEFTGAAPATKTITVS
jgi:hypothetical protein